MKRIFFRVFWDLLNLKAELRPGDVCGLCDWKLCVYLNSKNNNKTKKAQFLNVTIFRAAQGLHLEVEKCAKQNRDLNFQEKPAY